MKISIGAIVLAAACLSACQRPTELADSRNAVGNVPAAPAGAPPIPPPNTVAPPDALAVPPPGDASVSADIKTAFPDYKPKTTADTVTDYRAGVAGEISALPPVSDAAGLATAFVIWKAKAAASPGAMEAGAVQLGADPQEYKPSDAELVAAETGDRLSAALKGADEATKAAVRTVLGDSPEARVYRRFDYRHVDVMGSGRYFYASRPREASLPG
ncbi:MAG TPA: hypothetical protein VG942_10410 [Hyphomonadaceae bacterium]|nr:hypothetical protein [Hyphomonadaceae bacterium]